jgi:hypothetical protein
MSAFFALQHRAGQANPVMPTVALEARRPKLFPIFSEKSSNGRATL